VTKRPRRPIALVTTPEAFGRPAWNNPLLFRHKTMARLSFVELNKSFN
jgi:hypothetical protein